MMIVPAKYIMKVQELVELEDLNKTYIESKLHCSVIKSRLGRNFVRKLFTIWQNR